MRTLSANLAVELPEASPGLHSLTLVFGAFALNSVAELPRQRQRLRKRFQAGS